MAFLACTFEKYLFVVPSAISSVPIETLNPLFPFTELMEAGVANSVQLPITLGLAALFNT